MPRTSPRRLLAAALALALAGVTGVSATGASAADPSAFGVDLTAGDWRFRTGDDLAWKAPSFDDSAWEARKVPDNWGETEQSSYDGYAWYRKAFTLPARPAGLSDSSLILAMGFIDDADVTYVNGVQVGATGKFPPAFDAEWDVPREYYPPSGALKWGQRNVVAVRMYDGTGGGGFYKGPVGLFTKQRLRTLRGLITTPATAAQTRLAQATLAKQTALVARRDLDGYLRTLSPTFFHSGDTRARRAKEVRGMLGRFPRVVLTDAQTEVVVDRSGRLVVDTIRSWTGVSASGARTAVYTPTRQFLYLDPRTGLELGDRSRFFRDSHPSTAMKGTNDFSVYLPPSYTRTVNRRYPVVYVLHGINGSNIEWEVRGMDRIVDRLIADKGIAEAILVFPNGSSGWYVDSSDGGYRSMILEELLPLVDRTFRTIPDRDHRALTGVSMGGFGAYSIGLENPDLFSSLASHIGALSLPPLAGTPAEMAANSRSQPLALVNRMTTAELLRHTYYFDAGDQDDFRFGEAARAMDASLTAKLVPHDWQTGPGRHDDAYWVPKLDRSFGLHTKQFRAHPYTQVPEPR